MRRAIPIIAAAACVAIAVLCGFRIEQVNSAYPQQHSYVYSVGSEAVYAGQNSSGEEVDRGSIAVRALNFRSVGYGRIREMVPGYTDSSIEEGTASDMRALLIDLEIVNTSSDVERAHVRDYHVESNAWMNGLYAPLYMSINDDPSTIVELEPGEKVERTLVYLIYDTQMNSRGDWERVEQRSYSLELALYPDKYSIDLGAPDVGRGEGGSV
ncbi:MULTISPECIES: hypothetical protein [unclassified Adlercreutzia]|uniref:hypothetical protein n=1 Tax=unclassified Adlercreutzia TaxID=2636013 RepID=UPI0013EB52BF|nr:MULTISPECIES: hypothetical protein [unclassified Adlercreutzia]